MRRVCLFVALSLLPVFALGCGQRKDASTSSTVQVMPVAEELQTRRMAEVGGAVGNAVREQRADFAPAPSAPAAMDAVKRVPSRKLIRSVQIDALVAEVDSTRRQAQALAIEMGGYVAHVDSHLENGVPFARVSLRVPVDKLDAALVALRRLAVRVVSEQQNVQDVTEQWVDLDAQLRTLRATEKELLALLAESRKRGQKLADIMAVYRELTGIRSQIEQLEGQLKSLDQLAALSSIDVTLRPVEAAKPVVAGIWRPGDSVRKSFRTLVTALTGLANAAIFVAVAVLPIAALILVPAFWLVRRARQRQSAA